MKLRYAAAFLLSLTTAFSFAQNVKETTVESPKGKQTAFVAEYNAPEAVVEAALAQKLETSGLKKSGRTKGFTPYYGVSWTAVSPDQVDVFTKVDSRKGVSTVTLLVSKGYDNFISTGTDAEKAGKVTAFLTAFGNDVRLYQLGLQIAAQSEAIAKAEKALKDDQDAAERLIRDREKIEKAIVDNKSSQERRQQAIVAERSKLEALRAQLTPQ